MLTLDSRRIQDQLTVVHKMKFNNINLDFNSFFQKINLRRIIPETKTKIRQNFFSCYTMQHWNNLKSLEIDIQNSQLFKKAIPLPKQFYNIFHEIEYGRYLFSPPIICAIPVIIFNDQSACSLSSLLLITLLMCLFPLVCYFK